MKGLAVALATEDFHLEDATGAPVSFPSGKGSSLARLLSRDILRRQQAEIAG